MLWRVLLEERPCLRVRRCTKPLQGYRYALVDASAGLFATSLAAPITVNDDHEIVEVAVEVSADRGRRYRARIIPHVGVMWRNRSRSQDSGSATGSFMENDLGCLHLELEACTHQQE
jgi:hypothetical protein